MSDVSRVAPTRHTTLIRWLRINLAVTIFIMSLASGAVGFLISGAVRVTSFEYRMSESEKSQADLHENARNANNRLDAMRDNIVARSQERSDELSKVNQRLGVLESQMQFLADRQTPAPAKRR